VDTILDFRAEEALAYLFQPDTVAFAEYFKIYERKPGLEPKKKLVFAVLQDAIACFQSFVCATDKRRKKQFLKAEEWFNEEESEWIFSFENICETLGLDPQYLRQGLLSWKRKRLTEFNAVMSGPRPPAPRPFGKRAKNKKHGQTTMPRSDRWLLLTSKPT